MDILLQKKRKNVHAHSASKNVKNILHSVSADSNCYFNITDLILLFKTPQHTLLTHDRLRAHQISRRRTFHRQRVRLRDTDNLDSKIDQ